MGGLGWHRSPSRSAPLPPSRRARPCVLAFTLTGTDDRQFHVGAPGEERALLEARRLDVGRDSSKGAPHSTAYLLQQARAQALPARRGKRRPRSAQLLRRASWRHQRTTRPHGDASGNSSVALALSSCGPAPRAGLAYDAV